ncbi:MAG: CocE/NonD family hydrolase [Candidatus Omnitrophota bacterium]
MQSYKTLFSLIGAIAILSLSSQADDRADYIRSHYAKFEYQIPMRDGVKLFTAVYTPNDRSQKYPILICRTPYSVNSYGADKYMSAISPHQEFEKEGFIFVYQDVRGKFMSEGEYVEMRPHVSDKKTNQDVDESSDAYDSIEWLLNHIENHNGKAGIVGISYPGFYASCGAIDSHPALKAVSPQAPIADWFWDDFHLHGAFSLFPTFNFFRATGVKREKLGADWPKPVYDLNVTDYYQFFLDLGPLKNVNKNYFHGEIDFWNQAEKHPNYDEFWQSRNLLPHLKNIKTAVMVVGGWFDTEDLYGPLNTYRSIEEKNQGIFNVLVMGPWSHGGWSRMDGQSLSDADFGFKTANYYQENVDLTFFKHFLKDDKSDLQLPEALMFETGANRWRRFDAWPPKKTETKSLYLQEGGALSFETPKQSKETCDSYISDPNKPVPYSMKISFSNPAPRGAQEFYAEDQRFAARRPDVLVYQTPPLEQDLTIAGPIGARLFVSTSGTDSDWIIKLIDVHPLDAADLAGAQLLVRAQPFRGRFRDSYEFPKPFKPGEITKISFEMTDVCHTFQRGHRMMIQIQSSWFPFIDRNPQKYVPNIFQADESDFVAVTNKIYHSKAHPTHLEIKILQQ